MLATTQGSVQHVADLLGDWREEVVTFADGELRIYGTSMPATDRRISLMQDPLTGTTSPTGRWGTRTWR